MKHIRIVIMVLGIALMAVWLVGCQQNLVEPTPTLGSTATPKPTATPTPIPIDELTTSLPSSLLPGVEMIPLDEFSLGIPWLNMNYGTPRTKYVLFNKHTAAFNDPLVRQALSYAIDREAITEMDSQHVSIPHRPASVMTPPEVLGRDLYDAVGINYDPQKAKDLFVEAGFQDPSDFPEITFMMTPFGSSGPGGNMDIVNAVIEMWGEHLGISVNVEKIDSIQEHFNLLSTDSYDVVLISWAADYTDPNKFLFEPFHTNEPSNVAQYANLEFDSLVEQAAEIKEPADRQALYILAEDILCDEDPALIPLFFFGNPFE